MKTASFKHAAAFQTTVMHDSLLFFQMLSSSSPAFLKNTNILRIWPFKQPPCILFSFQNLSLVSVSPLK